MHCNRAMESVGVDYFHGLSSDHLVCIFEFSCHGFSIAGMGNSSVLSAHNAATYLSLCTCQNPHG
jgi:hypothetical protein